MAADLAGVDAETLRWYTELSNRGYIYFTELHYDVNPTADEVEKWFKDHEAEYTARGISKDGEKSVNVRHILLVPAEEDKPAWAVTGEEEVAQVAEDGKVTCSEALWEKGRLNAEKLLKTWSKNFEASEFTFANDAYHNSADEGSRVNGGLYTGIRKGQLAPVLEEFSLEHAEVAVGKVDVDQCPDLAKQFRVMSIPTLILFKEGKIVDQKLGYQPKNALEDMVKKAL